MPLHWPARAALEKYPSARYVAPFAAFLLLLAIAPRLPLDPRWESPIRVVLLGLLSLICWPREISLQPKHWLASTIVGAVVFLIWIAPDLLFPEYRNLAPFSNSIVGHVHSSLPSAALRSPWVLGWRTARAVVIVPVIEELFWRAWLMRWLINPNFRKVPLGAYSPFAFWVTAVLFASEHGPYWDVGLATGVIYNLWMIRSKSIADCILMHAVTNAILSAYVIAAGQWQYWQ
ncbi:MAG: CAAX prenyl protease-related protein [Bryobacteraceae bacterium]